MDEKKLMFVDKNEKDTKTSIGAGIAWGCFWIAAALAYASKQIVSVL